MVAAPTVRSSPIYSVEGAHGAVILAALLLHHLTHVSASFVNCQATIVALQSAFDNPQLRHCFQDQQGIVFPAKSGSKNELLELIQFGTSEGPDMWRFVRRFGSRGEPRRALRRPANSTGRL